MVEFFLFLNKARVMIASKWLIVSVLHILLLQSSAYKGHNRIFGDVTDDDVAIDNLEDFLRARGRGGNSYPSPEHGSHMLTPTYLRPQQIPSKIPFAVPPSDPRFFWSQSRLRGEPANTNGEEHSINDFHHFQPLNDVVPQPENRNQPYPKMKNRELHSQNPIHHFSAAYDESENRPDESHSPKNVQTGIPTPEKYQEGNMTPQKHADKEHFTSQPEAVNFLQQSKHEAQIPQYLLQHPGGGHHSPVISDFYFVALVSGCTAAAVCAVLGAGICYFKLHKSKRDAADAEYPAYGVTGPSKDFSPGAADRKLAQSAHIFHYQHQKQQMIALEKSSGDERHCSTSDVDSEEEGEEGDITVYECPGLAPTGEMEVRNPLFSDDPTPVTPALAKATNDVRKDQDDDEED